LTLLRQLEANTFLCPGLRQEIELGKGWKSCRVVFRAQLPVEDLVLRLKSTSAVEVRDLAVYRETQMIAETDARRLQRTASQRLDHVRRFP